MSGMWLRYGDDGGYFETRATYTYYNLWTHKVNHHYIVRVKKKITVLQVNIVDGVWNGEWFFFPGFVYKLIEQICGLLVTIIYISNTF